jgi:hypothetical protein
VGYVPPYESKTKMTKGKLGKAGLTGPLVKKKQEPLPSPLERPKRKFKFDEEE